MFHNLLRLFICEWGEPTKSTKIEPQRFLMIPQSQFDLIIHNLTLLLSLSETQSCSVFVRVQNFSALWIISLKMLPGHLETLLQDEFVVGFLDLVYRGWWHAVKQKCCEKLLLSAFDSRFLITWNFMHIVNLDIKSLLFVFQFYRVNVPSEYMVNIIIICK